MKRGRPKRSGYIADFREVMGRGREIEPYSNLQSCRKRERLDLIKRVVAYLSGSDYGSAMADLQDGADYVSKIRKLWIGSVGERGNTVKNKEFRVNVGQILLPEFPRNDLLKKGIQVGRDLYSTIVNHAKTGGGVFSYKSSGAGRKIREKKGDIAAEWVARSEPARRVTSNGQTVRRLFGSVRTHALEISTKCGVSLSTAYKFRPSFVVKRKNIQDLCLYCETLMKLRQKAIKLANGFGANIGVGSTYPGQHLAKGPGRDAIEFLRENRDRLDGNAASILDQIPVLEAHEELVTSLSDELQNDIKLAREGEGQEGNLVIQYDFRSLLELIPVRGDSWDYYNVQKMNVLGMAVYFPGKERPVFVDIISPDLRHDSEAAAAAVVRGIEYALDRIGGATELKRLACWADCGRHFRNRFIAYEILANNFLRIPAVELRFVGENHGKSVVDSHFNWVGTCVKNARSSWGNPPADLARVIRVAAQNAPNGYSVEPIFVEKLELDHVPTMIDFRDVSVAHKICRRGDKFYLGGKQIRKKIVIVEKEGKETRKRNVKLNAESIVGAVANKLKKRRTLCDRA